VVRAWQVKILYRSNRGRSGLNLTLAALISKSRELQMKRIDRVIRYLVRIYLKLPVMPFRGALARLLSRYKLANRNRVVTDTIDGITYSLDLNEVIDSFIYYAGCHEPGVTKFIDKYVKRGMTVLDVGANVGCHALRFAKVVGAEGKVIAFEPTAWAFSKLERNVGLNSFNNITLEKLALSDVSRKDTVTFPSSWTLDKGGLPGYVATEQVDLITLDDYVNTNKISNIDLIKIDVDGYEYKVIRGGYNSIKRFKPAIIIELGRFTLKRHGDNLEDLVDLLISLDYSFYSENDLKVYRNRDEILKAVPDNDEIINVVCRIKN